MIGIQIAPFFLIMHSIFILKWLYWNYYCYRENKFWLKMKKNKKYFIWVLDSNHNTTYYNQITLYPLHQHKWMHKSKDGNARLYKVWITFRVFARSSIDDCKRSPRYVIFKYLKLLVSVRLNGSNVLFLLPLLVSKTWAFKFLCY